MEPLISIIMPVYNVREYIERAVDSVISQTYSNWELIIVDDKSADGTGELIEKYRDTRIKYVENDKNYGAAYSRNRALDMAAGEYIAFLDGDDYWAENRLKNQVRFMQKNGYKISHGSYFFCDTTGRILKKVEVDKDIDYEVLLRGNQFKIMTVMLRKDTVSEKRFEEIRHEDYAFFLDVLKSEDGSVAYGSCDSYCTIGRRDSISHGKLKSAMWTWRIYRDHEQLGFFKSLFYFINYAYQGICKYR